MRFFSPFQRPSLDATLESHNAKNPPRRYNPLIKIRTLQSFRSTTQGDKTSSDLVSTLKSLSITQPDLVRTILDDIHFDALRQGTEAIFKSFAVSSVDDSEGTPVETRDDRVCPATKTAKKRWKQQFARRTNPNALPVDESHGVEVSELGPKTLSRGKAFPLAAGRLFRANLASQLRAHCSKVATKLQPPTFLLFNKRKNPVSRDRLRQNERQPDPSRVASPRLNQEHGNEDRAPGPRKAAAVMILPFVQRKGKFPSGNAAPHHDLPSLLSSSLQESYSEGCGPKNQFPCGNVAANENQEDARVCRDPIDKFKRFIQCGYNGDDKISGKDNIDLILKNRSLQKLSTAGDETSTASSPSKVTGGSSLAETQETSSTQGELTSCESSSDTSAASSSLNSFQVLVNTVTGSNLSFLDKTTLNEAMEADRRWVW